MTAATFWSNRAVWPALFILYFLLQALVRLLFGPALELDEAEAFWFARNLALGYNAQPPLYFWLQWGMFQVFGETLLALALLKAALLSTSLIVLYRLLLTALPAMQAGIAAASLSLLPQVVWESQRALTHSVLATTMAVILFAVAWRVIRGGRWRDHLALGVVIGLGILSKYNFAVLPVGVLLAAILHPDWRRGLRPVRVMLAAIVALAMVAPVAWWSLHHPEVAGGSIDKFGLAAMSPLQARATGVLAFVAGLAAFLALPVVVLGMFWMRRDRGRVFVRPPVVRFLGLGAGVALLVLVVAIIVTGVTEVKDRWLLPLAWPLVPVAVAGLWPVSRPGAQKGLGWVIAGLWLLAVLCLPYATLRDPGYRAADFTALMDRVTELAPGAETILSNRVWVLGNLAHVRPDLMLGMPSSARDGRFVLITSGGIAAATVSSAGWAERAGPPVPYDIVHGNRTVAVEITVVGPTSRVVSETP